MNLKSSRRIQWRSLVTRRGRALPIVVGMCVLALAAGCGTLTDSESPSTSDKPVKQAQLFPDATDGSFAPPDDLVAAAEAESGDLLVYSTNAEAQMADVFAAFKAQYPFVKSAKAVSLTAGEAATRILQEGSAGKRTADINFNSNDNINPLVQRDAVLPLDAKELGVAPGLVVDGNRVLSSFILWGIIYNKNLVKEGDLPETWEDLLDSKWSGEKVAVWTNPSVFTHLVPKWGSDRVKKYVEDLKGQQPLIVDGPPATVVGKVASGEALLTPLAYQTMWQLERTGAPLGFKALDLIPVTLTNGYIPKAAENPNTAKLFLSWSASREGNEAWMKAVATGLPIYPGLVQDLTKGHEFVGVNFDQVDMQTESNKILSAILVGK